MSARVKTFKNCSRSFATAADIFAGITKHKEPGYKAQLPPPSYGGRHIVSMLPGNYLWLVVTKII